jgi:hypothetical protein
VLGQARDVRSTPFGDVGTVFSGQGIEMVWVSKPAEPIDQNWFSSDRVDLILVVQGQLKFEFESPGQPDRVLSAGEVLVVPPDSGAGRTDGHAIGARRPYLSPPTPPARARMATERAEQGCGSAAHAHQPGAAGTRRAGPLAAQQASARLASSAQIAHLCAGDDLPDLHSGTAPNGGSARILLEPRSLSVMRVW